MTTPGYQEFAAGAIPVEVREGGGTIKVIAGETDGGTVGPVVRDTVSPLYLDVSLARDAQFTQRVPETHGGFLYVVDGRIRVGAEGRELPARSLGVLGAGGRIEVSTDDTASRFLLVAGRELNEPVARGGPFVMNTKEEVLQALQDYQRGRF